jgi:hypothetical protein
MLSNSSNERMDTMLLYITINLRGLKNLDIQQLNDE